MKNKKINYKPIFLSTTLLVLSAVYGSAEPDNNPNTDNPEVVDNRLVEIQLSPLEKNTYNGLLKLYQELLAIVMEDIDPTRPLSSKNLGEGLGKLQKNILFLKSLLNNPTDKLTVNKIAKTYKAVLNVLETYEEVVRKKKSSVMSDIDFSEKNNIKLFNALKMSLQKAFGYILEENKLLVIDNLKPSLQLVGNLTNTLLAFASQINVHLKSGFGYFKLGFLKEQLFDKKKIILDNPDHYQRRYQSGILSLMVQETIDNLHTILSILTELQMNSALSAKNFLMLYKEFIYKTLVQEIAFLTFLIDTEFQFSGKPSDLKNSQAVKNRIRSKVEKKIQEMIKKYDKKYFSVFDSISFNDKIASCDAMIEEFNIIVNNLNKKEENCRLYPIQVGYRSIYNYIQSFNNKGYIGQGLKAIKDNALPLCALYGACDYALFIEGGRSGLFQSICNVGKSIFEFYNIARNGGDVQTENFGFIDTMTEFAVKVIGASDKNIVYLQSSVSINPGQQFADGSNKIINLITKLKELSTSTDKNHDQSVLKLLFLYDLIDQRLKETIPSEYSSVLYAIKQNCQVNLGFVREVNQIVSGANFDPNMIGLDFYKDPNIKKSFEIDPMMNEIIAQFPDYSMTETELKVLYDQYNPSVEKGAWSKSNIDFEKFKSIYELNKKRIEYNKECAAMIHSATKGFKNQSYSGIVDKLHSLPAHLGTVVGGSFVGWGIYQLGSMLKDFAPVKFFKDCLDRCHTILLGEDAIRKSVSGGEGQPAANEVRAVNAILPEEKDKIDLDGSTWSHWPEETLSWFKNMLKLLEYQIAGKPVPNSLKNISKSVYLIGQSGAGKSYLIDCWSKLIASLQTQYKVNFNVNVVALDPKHFDSAFHASNGPGYMDLFEEISNLIEEARAKGEIYIFVIDEAHLLFINKETQTIDTVRLAAGLKFFSELSNKQKYRPRIGGVYIILATNRPSLIPHEFLANGGRIGEVVYIPTLESVDCVKILKSALQKNACSLNNIDFDYFQDLFSNYDLNYGKIEKIVHKAIYISNILNISVNTKILKQAFDSTIRNIVTYGNRDINYTPEYKKSITAYYAAITALTYFLDRTNAQSIFDCVTIAPIIKHPHPEDVSKLYLPSREKIYSYGDIFTINYCENDIVSEESVLQKILSSIGGAIYLKEMQGRSLLKEDVLSDLFEYLFKYYANLPKHIIAAKKLKIADEALYMNTHVTLHKFDEKFGNETEIHKHIQGMLYEAEICIKKYFSHPSVRLYIEYIQNKFAEKYTLHKDDIYNDAMSDDIKQLFFDVKIIYDVMIEEMKNIIHKYTA
jgi:hypothetical protein